MLSGWVRPSTDRVEPRFSPLATEQRPRHIPYPEDTGWGCECGWTGNTDSAAEQHYLHAHYRDGRL